MAGTRAGRLVGPLQTLEAEDLVCAEGVWLEAGPNPLCLGMVKSNLG